jgi:hypothetical protein
MGFMDKFKQVADAAKAPGQSMANLGGPAGAAAHAAKVNKIGQQGVQHPAILRGLRDTGTKDPLSGGEDWELDVEVRPPGGAPYSATFTQQLLAGAAATYQQKIGSEVAVKVDPDDPQSMLIWG